MMSVIRNYQMKQKKDFFFHCPLAEAEDTVMGTMFEMKHNG